MLKTDSSLAGLCCSVAVLLGTVLTGCGDGPTCPTALVAVIQSPGDGLSLSAADDLDSGAAGTQVDIAVRSNLRNGDDFELTITDESNAVALYDGTSNSDGDVTFAGVTLPAGALQIEVTGTSDDGCGTASDSISVVVITEALCALTIDEGPIDNAFFAPIPVLNSSNDSNLTLPNFQASVTVSTSPGFTVEVFVLDAEGGPEASLGSETADTGGAASFPATLAQGRQAIRATCSQGAVNESSATNTVHVDTVVPSCQLTAPQQGVTVTPDDDTDAGADGVQMVWQGTIDDGAEDDTEGEDSSFFSDSVEFPGNPINAAGEASTTGLGAYTVEGTYAMQFVTQDHAGNECSDAFDVNVIMDGCSIEFSAPTMTITSDSSANGADGLQSDFTVLFGTDCMGETGFVDCGNGEISAVIPANGNTTFADVTVDTDAVAEGQTNCTARVVNSDNFQTSRTQPFAYDTQAPTSLLLFSGGLSCGDSIANNVANDLDMNLGPIEDWEAIYETMADVFADFLQRKL
jgi:hypothetical protein